MRVFVTGASGWIGSAVVPELIGAGHQVVGLARSDASAEALGAAGAVVLRGTIDDLDLLRDAAKRSDGVIHLAFKHDIAFTGDFVGAAQADRRAIETIGDALEGSDRPLVIASGTLGLAPGRVATEGDGRDPDVAPPALIGGARARLANAHLTLALASRGIRSSVLGLPPTVHGNGEPGFISALVQIARDKGVAGYLGDGSNRWPAVHRTMPHASSAWRWSQRRRHPPCMRSATRACRSARSPMRSGDTWGSQYGQSPPMTPPHTSRGWPTSSGSTAPHRALSPARCSDGSPITSDSSRISTRATISTRRRLAWP